ncbi:MAG: cytochrome c [Rhodospirillaceae bacterium]
MMGAALASAALFAADARAAPDTDADAVTYRRHVMKTMGEQAAALGMVLQQKGPAENAAIHARTIALTAKAALKAFEVQAPGGEAKAEIWRNWPDFAKRLKTLSDGADDLAAIAEREGLSAMQAKVMSVLSCKSCHDAYTLRQGR